ncbi:hypothetical protein BD408DRAFT_434729 [Parasitella parasitica]|nr:hypothetical protein BD408DRAFT_434729 [Parasitella parasitica]
MFSEGYFYILSRKHGFALDVYDGQTKSGHVMDISSNAFKSDKIIEQKKRKASKQSQEVRLAGWLSSVSVINAHNSVDLRPRLLCSKEYTSLVLDIGGDSPKGGAQMLLYKRKDTDNLNQLWQFEPYQQFENALNMAISNVPLHKKEGFCQPRPGYAAELGMPPELKTVPENNKIAGAGNNVSPSSTTNAAGDSRIDSVLANYDSFYGVTSTAPPATQPGQAPSAGGYPPSPSPRNDNYPPSTAQPGQAPFPSCFPEPIPANATSSFSPPPPPPASTGGGYPSVPNYPPSPQSPSNYPPSYPSQQVGSGYPPSSPSNYNAYPSSPSGYPPAPIIQIPTSPPSYPSYPPSNANSEYPPASTQQQPEPA